MSTASTALTAARIFGIVTLIAIPVSTAIVNTASALFAVACFLAPEFWRGLRNLPAKSVALASVLLLLALAIGATYSAAPWSSAFQYFAKYRKLIFLPLLIVVFGDEKWQKYAITSLFAVLTIVLIASCANYLGWTTIGSLSLDEKQVGGVFKQRITQGLFMAFLAYLGLVLSHYASRQSLRVLLYVIAALALINVLIMTQGRTGQVVLLPMLAWWAWTTLGTQKSSPRRWAALIGVVAVICIALGVAYHRHDSRLAGVGHEIAAYESHDQATSVGLRLQFYQRSLHLIREKPLIGHGTGSVTEEMEILSAGKTGAQAVATTNPHNEYLLMGVQLGIVGMILFVALLGTTCLESRKIPSLQAQVLQGYWIAFALGCLVNSFLLDFSEGYMFVFICGILLAGTRGMANERKPVHGA